MVRILHFSLPRARVQSLAETRSHKLCSAAAKKKKKKSDNVLVAYIIVQLTFIEVFYERIFDCLGSNSSSAV